MHDYEQDIAKLDTYHSWAAEIMKLPLEQCERASEIIDDWIKDEVDNLFPDSENVSWIVQAIWIYLLEHEAIAIWSEKEPFLSQAVPYIIDSYQAVVYCTEVHSGDASDKDKQKAQIFLQLMDDGYMKPDVAKLIEKSKSLEQSYVNVSLRKPDVDDPNYIRINNIERLKKVNDELRQNIESLQQTIDDYYEIAYEYRDIYDLISSDLSFNDCYSDDEFHKIMLKYHMKFSGNPLSGDQMSIKTYRKTKDKELNLKEKAVIITEAIMYCKQHNLVMPEEKIILAEGTLIEKRKLAMRFVLRMNLHTNKN